MFICVVDMDKKILYLAGGLGILAIGYLTYKQLSKSTKITTTQKAPVQQTQQPNGIEAYQQFQQIANEVQKVSNQIILEAHKQATSKIEADPSLTSEAKKELITSISGTTLQKVGVAPQPQQYQQIAGAGNIITGTPGAEAPGTPAGSVSFIAQTSTGKVRMYYDPWTKQYVMY
jgi:dsDNA-specific endonuclease/ATPase MutS2